MGRFVDSLIQDGIDAPIDLIGDPTEQDLVDVRQKRLCHHWRAAQRLRSALPRRSDMSASFLAGIEDHTMLIRNGKDLRYEQYGRAIAQAYGRDMTGRSIDDFPSLIGQLFRSVYRLCEVKRVPIFTRHAPPPSVPVDHWLRLIVPLDEAGHDAVTHFLVCNIAVGRKSG